MIEMGVLSAQPATTLTGDSTGEVLERPSGVQIVTVRLVGFSLQAVVD